MHMPPALRRWAARCGLAVVVAIAIGYLPGSVLRRDSRTVKLHQQLDALDTEAAKLTTESTQLHHEIEALRTDVGAIEDRARADLGLVYPDEVVIHLDPSVLPHAAPTPPAPATAPAETATMAP